MIVPTLCVGMPQGTLRVPTLERDAQRPGLHSHAERGNDRSKTQLSERCPTRLSTDGTRVSLSICVSCSI
ncbi:hypothetical protein PFAS1_03330 [Pseudomonas frederiksbergensis]|nr:hypothetical protein PFAS1_03330 [Pseudomonas frederiksbergensis]